MSRQVAFFAGVIAEFGKRAAAVGNSPTGQAALYRDTLESFLPIHDRSAKAECRRAAEQLGVIQAVMAGYESAVEVWRKRQVHTADEFNILEVLELTNNEVRHSMVLAWLLDRDMTRYGTHAQGSLGFGLFLQELRLPVEYSNSPYVVNREPPSDESRIDIEIAARGQFLIHIENKIWSGEGQDQTQREWSDMQRRAEALGITAPEREKAIHGLLLTPRGLRAGSANFRPVSWGQVARVLDRFSAAARPPDVRLFASHYARTLRRFIIEEAPEEEPDRGQGAIQRGTAMVDPELG